MSRAMNLIAGNFPGYVPAEGRCLPCSGISATAVNVSTCSSHGHYKSFSRIKISLKCSSRSTSYVCSATPGSYRRNSDFSKQNKHGFSRRTNRQNEERDDGDHLEEPESFPSKNGPFLSVSGTQKFQATATPGPREKEIVELFRKVQAKLRQRTGIKEEKKVEDPQGGSKQGETVDSLLNLLRKHSVQKGKRNSSGSGSGSSRDFVLDQPEHNGPFSEKKSSTSFQSNNKVKHEVKESETSFFSRPTSKFQRRSPIPQANYRPSYSNEDTVNSISHPNINGNRKKASPEAEPKLNFKPDTESLPEPESDSEPEPEPIFSNGGAFDDMLEYETSDIDEGDNDEDEEEPDVIQQKDLSELKLAELRALAKSRGMKGFSKLKKQELLELLTGGSI